MNNKPDIPNSYKHNMNNKPDIPDNKPIFPIFKHFKHFKAMHTKE